jgi:hypothetical protein
MKVALCLHGLFNSTQDPHSKGIDGYNHIKKNILDKGDVDVFVHSTDLENQSIIEDLYKPVKSHFEDGKDWTSLITERELDKLPNTPRSPQSVLSHFYSVSMAMRLPYQRYGIDGTKYDVIIKSRFDLGRINRNTSGPFNPINPFAVQCINFTPFIQRNTLYMADWGHFHMGPADMWFYGDWNTMVSFSHLIDDLKEDMVLGSTYHKWATEIEGNGGDLSNSIAYYKWWMMKNNLWDKRKPLNTIWE